MLRQSRWLCTLREIGAVPETGAALFSTLAKRLCSPGAGQQNGRRLETRRMPEQVLQIVLVRNGTRGCTCLQPR